MRIDIWSDVVCPWCYIGKRRFDRALENLRHGSEAGDALGDAVDDIEIVYR
ncbi:MAG: DsbA family protein, partial [Actinomycetota bacterium]